jgi:hypothetical protein
MVLAPIVRRLPAAVNTRRLKSLPVAWRVVERRIVRRIARRAGITKAMSPQTLRHAFITSFEMSRIAFGASFGSLCEQALPAPQYADLHWSWAA